MRKTGRWHRLIATCALITAASAHAQFKCLQADGKVAFQQLPCAAGDRATPLKLTPGSPAVPPATDARRIPNWPAIARSEPAVGMTLSEMKQAMGEPDVANLAQYGANTSDQLIYRKGNRTLYVSLQGGVVTSIQITGAEEVRAAPAKTACPSPQQIKALEFEASRIANRENQSLQAELARAIACR